MRTVVLVHAAGDDESHLVVLVEIVKRRWSCRELTRSTMTTPLFVTRKANRLSVEHSDAESEVRHNRISLGPSHRVRAPSRNIGGLSGSGEGVIENFDELLDLFGCVVVHEAHPHDAIVRIQAERLTKPVGVHVAMSNGDR